MVGEGEGDALKPRTCLYVYQDEQLRQVLAGCVANLAPYIWQREESQRNF
jgi:hypothetical protein